MIMTWLTVLQLIHAHAQDPELQAFSEYPEWVEGLTKPLPTFGDLHRKVEAEDSLHGLTPYLIYRYFKLGNRKVVKEKNALKSS